MDFNSASPFPEGVISFLDTDLYKLTMQCAVYKWFRSVPVEYAYTNRTPDKKLSRAAYLWLQEQINKLGNISLSAEELQFLQRHCSYLTADYLDFLKEFRLRPREQVQVDFSPLDPAASPDDSAQIGDVDIKIKGSWVDTILYEIPILALTSEAYFRFMDTDWNYDGQEEKAFDKGLRLLEAGCTTSEFGTRRRRDYHTQALVFRGLVKASREAEAKGFPGKLAGTSNVHLAMRFGIPPVGTVAHEWFMGIAAKSGDYRSATEEALRHWVSCFGTKLSIALTDTFGTQEFLRAFSLPVRPVDGGFPLDTFKREDGTVKSYAEVFAGVRQDSGDPAEYTKMLRDYYDKQGITDKKTIVFSDSLNIERCLEYKTISEKLGFQPTFGVGTFLTNDFTHLKTGTKSVPLNIVIKLSSVAGRPAIKISDNAGKNTGDKETVQRVKEELGYVEREWKEGDETSRWGKEGDVAR
ncbi:Quinolinate phosphoribosyl transferase [Stachybotrys elegans]|uniref:Nicotinate phosphoribosyltransferase n=1 Tax=Stachybotrys elegans TaxID=80388 RepID=A0A8K0WNY6_9HYPO|nr:Quinolinate phosphoribosyl transferase [Stachybotrys elegans]